MNYFKTAFVLLAITVAHLSASAQIAYGGNPISETKTNLSTDIDHIQLRAPNMELIRNRDIQDEKNGTLQRIGHMIDVNLTMDNAGTWDQLSDGRQVWRLQISSDNAQALNLYFSEFDLPKGSQLFVYSPDRLQTIGAFNEKNNRNGGSFAIELIYGESLILEYISPRPRIVDGRNYQFTNLAKIDISRVNYVYRYANDPYRAKSFGSSGDCEVNINCSEGNNWQDEKRGVARIFLLAGGGWGWCTGSLVNNTNYDETPYFLTAFHCGAADATATELNQWQFDFNYESPDCANPGSEPAHNTIVGATRVAEGNIAGGSDFFLLELSSAPPAAANPYYNGWDNSGNVSANGVGFITRPETLRKFQPMVRLLVLVVLTLVVM